MIKIWYVDKIDLISKHEVILALQDLPGPIAKQIMKYKNGLSLRQSLLGHKLLVYALKEYGYQASKLGLLERTKFNKPYFETGFQFNISHTASMVILAVSLNSRVGIDVEKVKDINLYEIENLFTPQELKEISDSKRPNDSFYALWTMKEAILKGIGLGLNIPLKDVVIQEMKSVVLGERWFVKKILIKEDFICHIATEMYLHNNDVLTCELKSINLL